MLKRVAFVFVALAILGLGFLPAGAAAQAPAPPPDTSSILVKLIAGLSVDDQAAVVARNGGTETSAIPALRLHVIQVLTVELADAMARYAADPQVLHVEENRVRRSEFLSNDPLVTGQWALPQIGWDLVFGVMAPTGTAKVAVLDTGIDATHPDLLGRVVAGTSILDGSNGMTDPHGHGTQVAGIVAANTDSAAGVAGVAFAGVQVIPVTVLDANGEGLDSDVIAGVLWAADNGADVILMAFSNPGFSPNLQDAIDYAWSKGVVLVAAVGNDGAGTATFPAGDRGVIGVSGTDTADALLGYSNYGQAAFMAAPGENITTTDLGGGYVAVSGTSSSAAIIAGVAAFLKAVDPTLTNGMIVGRMARTADPAGTQDQTGNGRVNMARALEDTGTDSIQPAGADPAGDGGPFVGPYVAASVTSVTITSPTSGTPITITSLPGSVTVSFSYVTSPTGTTTGQADILGTGLTNSKSLAAGSGSDSIAVNVPAGTPNGSYNVKVTVTNSTGSGANNKNDNQNGAVVINVPTVAATNLAVNAATGTYGGTVNLTATLTSSGSDVNGKSVAFTLNGSPVGNATTNASGVATVSNVSLSGISAGTYLTAVGASFAGDSGFLASSGTGSLTVSPRPATVKADDKTKQYGDDNPALTATAGGAVNGDTLNYTLATTAVKFSGVGSYPITVTLGSNPNYTVTPTNGTLTVSPRPATVKADDKTKQYGDDNPALTVTAGGAVNGDTLNYTLATTTVKFSGVGNYPITVTLGSNPNYTVTPTDGTLTVSPRPATVKADDKTKQYGDDNPALTATAGGTVNGDTLNYTLATTTVKFSGVGNYPITVTLGSNPNYTVTPTNGILTITKAPLTVRAHDYSKAFCSVDPTFDVSYSGFVGNEGASVLGGTLVFTFARQSPVYGPTTIVPTLAGTYSITPSGLTSSNYQITFMNGTYTIGALGFTGFLQPIGGGDTTGGSYADTVRTFKLNSTIPAKFTASCNGAPVLTGIHTLQAIKYSNTTDSDAPIDATPTDAATTGNQFRLTDGQWLFNLNTKPLSQGTWQLVATLADGTVHWVWIAIKK